MPAPDNRANLLASALSLFVARGYDGVGIQEIVDAAKVTKPTLYHYFGSKQGLLEALLEEHLAELHAGLDPAADYRGDLPKTLDEVAGSLFAFARARPGFYRLLLASWFAPVESDAHRTAVRFHQRLYSLVEELFREAAHDHGNMRGRHCAYARTFLGMVNTYVSMALNGYAELDDRLRRQAVHQFMHGIFS